MTTKTLVIVILLVAAAAAGIALHTNRGAGLHDWLRTTIHGR